MSFGATCPLSGADDVPARREPWSPISVGVQDLAVTRPELERPRDGAPNSEKLLRRRLTADRPDSIAISSFFGSRFRFASVGGGRRCILPHSAFPAKWNRKPGFVRTWSARAREIAWADPTQVGVGSRACNPSCRELLGTAKDPGPGSILIQIEERTRRHGGSCGWIGTSRAGRFGTRSKALCLGPRRRGHSAAGELRAPRQRQRRPSRAWAHSRAWGSGFYGTTGDARSQRAFPELVRLFLFLFGPGRWI